MKRKDKGRPQRRLQKIIFLGIDVRSKGEDEGGLVWCERDNSFGPMATEKIKKTTYFLRKEI